MSIDLSNYAAVLLDLDGTIYHDERPLPGAIELIRKLQAEGRKFACLSNSTSSPYRISQRLKLIGTPTNLGATEERQRIALQLARKNALLIGICADRVYPSPRGIEFGAGALSAMLGYAASSQPVFCGKPQKLFFDELCTRLAVDPKQCVLVGDNVEADVFGAQGVGMKTILTLTGVTRRRDLLAVPKDRQPDIIVEDLNELL